VYESQRVLFHSHSSRNGTHPVLSAVRQATFHFLHSLQSPHPNTCEKSTSSRISDQRADGHSIAKSLFSTCLSGNRQVEMGRLQRSRHSKHLEFALVEVPEKVQKLKPPVPSSEATDFDPGAQFHVTSGVEFYIHCPVPVLQKSVYCCR
jgi:hypothetical protein